jgi:hypothetical protein
MVKTLPFYSQKEAASALGVSPAEMARLLYRAGDVVDALAPKIGTRRVVPRENLPALKKLLAELRARKRRSPAVAG